MTFKVIAEGLSYLEGDKLPDWITIKIVDNEKYDCYDVYINSRVHVRKEVKISWSYSRDWSVAKILNDWQLGAYVRKAYDLRYYTYLM